MQDKSKQEQIEKLQKVVKKDVPEKLKEAIDKKIKGIKDDFCK